MCFSDAKTVAEVTVSREGGTKSIVSDMMESGFSSGG